MVQEWLALGQQQKHVYTTPMITKDEEEQTKQKHVYTTPMITKDEEEQKRWECWQRMTKWQKVVVRCSKGCKNTRGTRLDLTFLFFLNNRGHQDIESWKHWIQFWKIQRNT